MYKSVQFFQNNPQILTHFVFGFEVFQPCSIYSICCDSIALTVGNLSLLHC